MALSDLLSRIDDSLDRRRMARRERHGQRRPVEIRLYRGWADLAEDRLNVRGRVVERPGGRLAPSGGGFWANFRATLRRFFVAEIMGAAVRVTAGRAEARVTTDSDGFFDASLAAPPGEGWLSFEATLEDFPGRSQPPRTFAGAVLKPPHGPGLAVISDLDDTVIRTGVADPLRNLRTIVAAEASARVAFPGLPALYRGLAEAGAPIAYVSSGAWNLYDLIEDFLRINAIPPGPMLFDDWGVDRGKLFTTGHVRHKRAVIERLLAGWPERDFILVGDSGQRDAEIFAALAREHPTRIRAIWIRDVHTAERRAAAREMLFALGGQETAVFVEPHLLDATEHAAGRGWIGADALEDARAEIAAARG